jgi:uncharacterized membrane protein
MRHTTTDEPRALRLLRAIKHVSGDLLAILALVVAVDVLWLLEGGPWALSFVLGLPLLLFAPGYVLVVALDPRSAGAGARFDDVERTALAFGMSLALLPLLGLALWLAGLGFSPTSVRGGVSLFVVVGIVVALARRLRVPAEERHGYSLRRAGGRLYETTVGTGGLDGVLNLLLVLSILIAASGVAYAVAVPTAGEAFTGFAVLTEDGSGELTASEYPTEMTTGEPASLTVTVDNHETSEVQYTVVAELQRVATDGDDVTVREREQLDRTTMAVERDGTGRWNHEVTPSMTGEDLRLSYYLYRGDAPDAPSAEGAYRHVYLRVDVDEPDA